MESNSFKWLQECYSSQCDGEWEHSYGVQIRTLDNPGWLIIIDLSETELENCEFKSIVIKGSEDDWINCLIRNNI